MKKFITMLLSLALILGALLGFGSRAQAAGSWSEGTSGLSKVNGFPFVNDTGKDTEIWGRAGSGNCLNGWHYSSLSTTVPVYATTSQAGTQLAYCISPGTPINNGAGVQRFGDSFLNLYPESWNDILSNDEIKILLGYLMYYGQQGILRGDESIANSADRAKMAKYFATQLLVWEVVVGERYADFSKRAVPTGSDAIISYFRNDNPIYNDIMSQYQSLESSINNALKRPSFMSGDQSSATLYELSPGGGMYQLSLSDSNGVLSAWQFSAASGINCQVSGNQLTLSSSQALPDPVLMTAQKAVTSAQYWVWGPPDAASFDRNNHNQPVVIQAPGELSKTHYAYMKIKTAAVLYDPVDILLKKQDAQAADGSPQGNASLAGAQYEVSFKAEDESVTTWVFETDQDGIIRYLPAFKVDGPDLLSSPDNNRPGFPAGVLTIKETQAPSGYLIDPNTYTVYFREVGGQIVAQDAQGNSFERIISEQKRDLNTVSPEMPKKVSLSLKKESASELPKGASLAGIHFALVNRSEKPIVINNISYAPGAITEIISTDEAGAAISGKHYPNGNYDIYELRMDAAAAAGDLYDTASLGYSVYASKDFLWQDNKQSLTVTDEDADGAVKAAPSAFTNQPAYGRVMIRKKLAGELQADLSGFSFTLSGSSDTGIKVKRSGSTDAKGRLVFENIPYGTYQVQENLSDAQKAIWVEKSAGSVTLKGEEVSYSLRNELHQYPLTIHKSFEAGSLSGWEFMLYGKTSIGTSLELKGKTDKDGRLIFQNVPVGQYNIKEINTPDWITIPPEQTAEISDKAEEVFFSNIHKEGSVLITKKDLDSGKPLAGAEFTLYEWAGSEYRELMKLSDKGDGTYSAVMKWTEENEGKFKLAETKAPAGYLLGLNESEKAWEFVLGSEKLAFEFEAFNMKPEIATTATDVTSEETKGGKLVPAVEKAVVKDVVTYKNLLIGKEYIVKGILMDKASGKAITDAAGKEITAETSFIPEKAEGSVELFFTFDASLHQGKSLVAFERLYLEDAEMAAHADPEDEEQTVKVAIRPEPPKIEKPKSAAAPPMGDGSSPVIPCVLLGISGLLFVIILLYTGNKKSQRPDSNRQPADYKSAALPLSHVGE